MLETVLLIEDDRLQQQMTEAMLTRKLGFAVHTAGSAEEALERHLHTGARLPDIVLLDMELPGMHGLQLLERIAAMPKRPPVIVLTGHADVGFAVRAMKLGAVDYITKPCSPERLQISIHNALKLQQLSSEVSRLKHTGGRFAHIIGCEGGLAFLVEQGRKAAANDLPVLVTGETGTGKELFARALHGESRRAAGPFIAVNCGAIPETLIESTLFGHEKGAFTGATHSAKGKFREAEGGTLFLDEVGELSPAAQVRLLRALQQREVEPVGGGKPVPVDVRVIAATHRNLEEEVRAGRFRDDLYFRLNVLTLHVPPLRERTIDIPALCDSVIDELAAREGLSRRECARETVALLKKQPWPGNVRELQNVLRRALAMSTSAVLQPEDMQLGEGSTMRSAATQSLPQPLTEVMVLRHPDGRLKTLEEIAREAIRLTVTLYGDNISAAAAALNVARSTCYRKMQPPSNS